MYNNIIRFLLNFFIFCSGAGKEYIYDRYLKKGTFSKQDMYDTFWGSATGMVFLRVGINEWEKKHLLLDSTQFQFKKQKP